MKPLMLSRSTTLASAVLLTLLGATPSFGQAAAGGPSLGPTAAGGRLMRGDVAGTIGWSTVNRSELASYNTWRGEGLFELRGGWYWTNHLKTSLDVSTTTGTDVYSVGPSLVGGVLPVYPTSRYELSEVHTAVTQVYQFGENAWVHPYVAGGVDVVRETRSQRDDPLFFYDQVTRQSRLLRDVFQHPDRTVVRAHGLVSAGIKAYLSRKAFFLTDFRVTVGRRAEQVHWSFGVGVDY
jgi:hypothetical protein